MERATRLLCGLAAILFLAGLALRIAPASIGAPREVAAQGTGPAPETSRRTPEAAGADTAIVGGNIFSASRSAPRVRYTPPDLAAPREPEHAPRRAAATALRLSGTVSGTAALIDANPAVPGSEIYQIGDLVGGKRLVAVSESTVVLEGPTGRTVLRLQPTHQPHP